jgi:3-methyladenine DNA glycosylase AlkC
MAEPFKNLIGRETVLAASRHLHRVLPSFNRARFERSALRELESLELKARAMQLCDALEETLPEEFARAAEVLEASLGPPGEGDGLGFRTSEAGLAGWVIWPMGEYVARRGLVHPERALRTLHAMTQRFSAEFAIRPFIAQHPALCFKTLKEWTADPSAHVRRLVSEGTRPRLPWGMQLKALIADPSPSLPLLRALQDDPSGYVRRSVANHLNDIAKDHPERVAEWLEEHLPGASAERRALLRQASRTLIKKGAGRVLAAWGLGQRFEGQARLALRAERVRIGEEIELTVELRSRSPQPQRLVIDYAVHHVRANGGTSEKVFKGWVLELPAEQSRELSRRHSFRPVTTRRYYPGRHTIELRINGEPSASGSFELCT